MSVDATNTATITILDNDMVGVEFDGHEYSIDVADEDFILRLKTVEEPDENFLVRVNLNKGASTTGGYSEGTVGHASLLHLG